MAEQASGAVVTAWLAALRTAWRVISSRPAIAVACAVVGALVALELAGRGSVEVTPYTARATKRAGAAPVVVETLPVAVLKPDSKTRAKIAADYRKPTILLAPTKWSGEGIRPLADSWATEVLAEVRIEPLPAGGTALTTIDRATGAIETTVKPSPEPRFSLRNRWEIAGAWGKLETGEPLIRAEVRWRPVKMRRLELGAVAGWERTDRGRAYVLGELAWGTR